MINFKKSMPAPVELETRKNNGSDNYRVEEVVIRVRNDFHNKCYLCELKGPTTINVEHFHPHRGDRNLMFDWTNLYYACGHCNNLKSHLYDSILNCLDPADDVENSIYLKMDPFPTKDVIVVAKSNGEKVEKTIELLEKIYNGSTTIKTVEAENIRKSLLDELLKFQNVLLKYYDLDDDDEEKDSTRLEIKRHLKESSAFTSFKRWIIKDSKQMYKDFGHFFQTNAITK